MNNIFLLNWLINEHIFPHIWQIHPDSKILEANMGPFRARQDPGGPYVGPMNFAIWVHSQTVSTSADNK